MLTGTDKLLFALTFNSSISEIFSMGQVIQMRVVQQGLKYTHRNVNWDMRSVIELSIYIIREKVI